MIEMELPLRQSLWFTHLVQVTFLAAFVWLVVKLFARRKPHLAHTLWVLVLVKCLLPPIVASPTAVLPDVQVANVPYISRLVSRQAINARSVTIHHAERAASTDRFSTAVPAEEVIRKNSISELSRDYRIRDEEFGNSLEESEADLPETNAGEVSTEEAIPPPPPAETRSSDKATESLRNVTLEPWWTGWIVICGAFLFVTLLRVTFTLHRVKRQQIETPAELTDLVGRLSKHFRLRRHVCICVTAAPIGPAVVGLLRPLLILPEVVLQGRSNEELEPIVAHELSHIKRGDLGVGWLQLLAQSLWWFHPLVWMVNRSLEREAERCCDESVLAELNCTPTFYARCLLSVVEQKRTLSPMPTCPGVKPVELTKQRMEQIMQLGQGCRRRTPWWCWLIVICMGLIVLPGRSESNDADVVGSLQLDSPASSKASDDEATLQWSGDSNAQNIEKTYPATEPSLSPPDTVEPSIMLQSEAITPDTVPRRFYSDLKALERERQIMLRNKEILNSSEALIENPTKSENPLLCYVSDDFKEAPLTDLLRWIEAQVGKVEVTVHGLQIALSGFREICDISRYEFARVSDFRGAVASPAARVPGDDGDGQKVL